MTPEPQIHDFLSAGVIRSRLCEGTEKTLVKDGFRRAAVLVPLFQDGSEWHMLLTKRTEDLEHHKGQISFPGGALEKDEGPEQAARRESFEEIALTSDRIEILARLDDIWTPSGYVITPVVGLIDNASGLRPDPVEVARILTVPIAFLADEAHARMQRVYVSGYTRDVYFYDYGEDTIWGATAFIIRDVLRRLRLID